MNESNPELELPAIPDLDPLPEGAVGMVAVVGRANTGKSTLVNRLLGEKVSIVSPIAQTTRNRVRGVLSEPRGQLVFLDTPGVHKAPNELGKAMNRVARSSVEGVDRVLLMLDGSKAPRMEDEGWMRRLAREVTPCTFVLNKLDLGTAYEEAYRAAWAAIATELAPERTVEWRALSAATGDGVEALLANLFKTMPHGPYLFPVEVLTDFPRKLAIGDTIREKLMRDLRDELPHSIAVNVNSIDEQDDQWAIDAAVYVAKFSQKGIVIGNKGRRIRAVRRAAERELAELYDRKVTLHLWVKVEKDWTRNFWILQRLGYTA